MLGDFEMIQHRIDGAEPVTIYPIADVHFGASEHMERAWSQFCIDVLKEPRSYIILGGDLVNNATKTSVSNVYEEIYRPREQKKFITEMLTPLRERILCAVTGNHERRSLKDVDSDITYDIMCKLDIEDRYRQNIAFMKIQTGLVDKRQGADSRPTYCFAVTHGSGGGILTGGGVNRSERFAYVMDGVDALIVGHTHKPWVTQPSKIKVDTRNNRVSVAPFKVISMSSWLEYSGYPVQKMLLPTSHARQVITLSGRKKEIRVEM